jgi:DNA-binding XRE family transcriptional regulator
LPGSFETGRWFFRHVHSPSEREVVQIFLMRESVQNDLGPQPCKTSSEGTPLFGPLWRLVSEGATHYTMSVRMMMDESRSTPLPGLAKHRRRRGLTQRELGELAGVAHTTVQQLETVSRGAYPQTLRKLASALGVEPADLVVEERR